MDASYLKLEDPLPPPPSVTARETRRAVPPPEPPTKRGRRWPWAALLIVLAATAGTWLWRQPQSNTPPRGRTELPQAVGTAAVVQGDLPIVFDGLGTVTPLATVTVQVADRRPAGRGRLPRGPDGRQGRLPGPDRPATLSGGAGAGAGHLARDQALLQQAQSRPRRYQTLIAQDSIARQQVDTQAVAGRASIEATLQTDQAAIDAQNST